MRKDQKHTQEQAFDKLLALEELVMQHGSIFSTQAAKELNISTAAVGRLAFISSCIERHGRRLVMSPWVLDPEYGHIRRKDLMQCIQDNVPSLHVIRRRAKMIRRRGKVVYTRAKRAKAPQHCPSRVA
jgi:hypothetical protein